MAGGTGFCAASCWSIASVVGNSAVVCDGVVCWAACSCSCVLRRVVGWGFMGGWYVGKFLGGLMKEGGEGFAGTMQFAAHGVAGLAGERADFVVAELFVGDEQEEELILLGKGVEGFLDALAQLLRLEHAQGILGAGGGAFEHGVVFGREDVPAVPGLEEDWQWLMVMRYSQVRMLDWPLKSPSLR